MEERIARLLEAAGPLTGAEIRDALGDAPFAQWRACMRSPDLAMRRVGRRYLRLDTKVEGYARLSPSILREFRTYTVVGLARDEPAVEHRAAAVEAHVREVSRAKRELAAEVATDVAARAGDLGAGGGGDTAGGAGDLGARADPPFCIVLAGDVVYDMAHDVPRPERSTGTLVRGSDLDLVVLVDDSAPDELIRRLDRAMYERKGHYLASPAFREEIDYVVKRFSRLREQTELATFKAMVAAKIFDEAVLLVGSEALFAAGKELLRERGVADWLRELERSAATAREEAEHQLLASEEAELGGASRLLFYTDHESEEFE
jgi:hypothetical protein